jgi:hypothetical protein
MEDKSVQTLRYKLQKRVRRVNSAEAIQFWIALSHLFKFIDSMPLLVAVKDDLLARTTKCRVDETVDGICKGETLYGETEEESAAIGYTILRKFCDNSESVDFFNVGHSWGTVSNLADSIEFARTTFLEPYYEYLDEHVDDQQAILYLLRRYKQRCEWFRSETLRTMATEDSQRGEKRLAFDLYEYLHEQGIGFYIEPRSASGIADLVAEQVGADRVVADAKLFWTDHAKGKPYVLSAFHQAYTYARDFNEPCAYLVIYKLCSEDINFLLPPTAAMFPAVVVNNKTIFFVVVDLCEHGVPASKRGVLKSYDITANELIQSISDESNKSENAVL